MINAKKTSKLLPNPGVAAPGLHLSAPENRPATFPALPLELFADSLYLFPVLW